MFWAFWVKLISFWLMVFWKVRTKLLWLWLENWVYLCNWLSEAIVFDLLFCFDWGKGFCFHFLNDLLKKIVWWLGNSFLHILQNFSLFLLADCTNIRKHKGCSYFFKATFTNFFSQWNLMSFFAFVHTFNLDLVIISIPMCTNPSIIN